MTTRRSTIVQDIAACVLTDNGAMIRFDDIAEALDADRGAGFRDPTKQEVTLLVCGSHDGTPPEELCAEHPALDALLTKECV